MDRLLLIQSKACVGSLHDIAIYIYAADDPLLIRSNPFREYVPL